MAKVRGLDVIFVKLITVLTGLTRPMIILCLFLAETSGYLCRSLQSLVQGSFTSFTKWHRRSDRTRKRQVVPSCQHSGLSSGRKWTRSFAHKRHWTYPVPFSRRSRRRRRILQGGSNLSDQSPLVPVETPRVLSHPPNLLLTRVSQAPTDTTENRTTRLISGTLAMTVRADRIILV